MAGLVFALFSLVFIVDYKYLFFVYMRFTINVRLFSVRLNPVPKLIMFCFSKVPYYRPR